MHFDLPTFIKTIGYLGIFSMVFAESGLLIGFFLPGDSLLFTAGFLASQGFLDIKLLALGCFVSAVAGDSTGYYMGHRFGRRLFHKEDSLFFHKEHLKRAHNFYQKHGGKTIILARFMPVVRTFAPIVAGIGEMNYTRFLLFNITGGVLWAIGLTSAGYFLGNLIPEPDRYLLPIVAAIIIASVLPGIYHGLKDKKTRQQILDSMRVILRRCTPRGPV